MFIEHSKKIKQKIKATCEEMIKDGVDSKMKTLENKFTKLRSASIHSLAQFSESIQKSGMSIGP